MPEKTQDPFSGRSLPALMVMVAVTGSVLAGLCLVVSQMAPAPADAPASASGLENSGHPEFFTAGNRYFSTHTPLEFLLDLSRNPEKPVTVLIIPDGWITRTDAEALIKLVDVNEPAAPVVSALSSYYPFEETSTVGNEALFLLEGYRTGRYPPALCSVGSFRPNRTAILSWWDAYGNEGLPDPDSAVRLVQETYPALRGFPSDEFPVRTIRTERSDDGWYVAFITEGSGVPITSARCFLVAANRSVREIPAADRSIFTSPDRFSARTCS